MAEALKMVDQGIEKLSKELTCLLCQQHFTDPRVLTCCHYFCKSCIQRQLATKSARQNGLFPCPECRKKGMIPQDDAGKLPVASFVDHLKKLHLHMTKLERKVEVLCEMCSAAKAEEFCLQCTDFICSECAGSHRKMKAKYPNHRVVTLEQLKKGGARLLPFKPAPPQKCCDHDEQLKLFCFDCNRLICRDCIVIDHSQHRYEFVKKSALYCKQTLTESLAPLKRLRDDIGDATKQIAGARSSVSGQGAYVTQHIEQSFEEIFEILNQRKKELLDEAATMVQSKMESLDTQENDLHASMTGIQTLVDFVEKNLELDTEEELLVQHNQLLSRVGKELQRQHDVKLAPKETTNIAVSISCAKDVTQACREKARVYPFPDQGSEVHMAEIGKQTTHYVIDHMDTSPNLLQQIEAKLHSLVDGSTVTGDIAKTGKGLYEVTYTPMARGRHELTFEVEGRPIDGSPFLVFVKIPPSKLGNPVMVIDHLRHPYAVVFDAEEHLLVTESGGQKIKVFKKGEKTLSLKEFAEHKIDSPTGLALDTEGNIYVANVSSHSVSKYNREGTCVKVVGREGNQKGEFNHPSGITVIGENVFVCDRNNSRIQVFDRQLRFIRSFGSHGSDNGQLHWPYDLVQDKTGHIYVTDCDNHRIQIFDCQGRFIHTFASCGPGKSTVKRPVGVCVGADDLLYVTEYAHHCVSVFQSNGQFISSFGTYGRKKGDFCYPVGVAIDNDGFVYVCDQGNNRIQVF